jgi:Uncharacterized protein conserved in bacteria (DUF2252)
LQAIGKLTTVVDGQRQIMSNPPLVERLDDMIDMDPDEIRARLRTLLVSYRRSLPSDRRRLFDHFKLIDVAHKVVGVGSVGTRAWILLLEGGVEAEALLLQAKEAGTSALSGYAGKSKYSNQRERVVTGQHLMQASSDIFLGWLRARPTGGRYTDYYLRQLRDWKMSAVVEEMIPAAMQLYAQLCGWTLARAHARAGDRVAISAYLGNSTKFDNAVADLLRRTPIRTNAITLRWQPLSQMDESRHSPGCDRALFVIVRRARGGSTFEPWSSQGLSASLRSLALPRMRRSVKVSPGSERRRRSEIWSADNESSGPDEPLPAFFGSSESSCAVVITPADCPVGALIKVRTRRPAYRLAAEIPRSLEASTDFWAAWLIHSGGDSSASTADVMCGPASGLPIRLALSAIRVIRSGSASS